MTARSWFALVSVMIAGLFGSAALVSAQSMFFDWDGDGVHSNNEGPAYTSGPQTVDVYVDTDYASIQSYVLHFRALASPFVVEEIANQMPGMASTLQPVAYPHALTVSYGGTTFPPGKYLLLRLRITFPQPCPIFFLDRASCFSPPALETGFGSESEGRTGDNFLRLGEDISFAWDSSCPDPAHEPPTLSSPEQVSGVEGQTMTFSASVYHVMCGEYPFGFSSWGTLPPDAVISPLSGFQGGTASQTVTWTPQPGQAGTYSMTFYVDDPAPFYPWWNRSTTRTTQIVIAPAALPANVFATPGNATTALIAGKPFTSFQIEPGSGASYQVRDIVPSSVRLRIFDPVCGGLEIPPPGEKSFLIRDGDHDGIEELQVRYDRDAWAALSACLAPGFHDLQMNLRCTLATGEAIQAEFLHRFLAGPGTLATRIAPNPLRAGSTLELTTSAPGLVRTRLYDARGRYLGTLHESAASAGPHQIPLVLPSGKRLASGVYFIRVDTDHDGFATRRITIVR